MLLIGLWNSPHEYKNTVHNLGQLVILELMKNLDTFFPHLIWKKKSICVKDSYMLIKYKFNNKLKINLLLLEGYINSTGYNLVTAGEEIDIIKDNEEVVALYDDVGLLTKQVIISYAKGSSRHNGATGLDSQINKNYWRIRIGMTKPKHINTKDFVLQEIEPKDEVRKVVINLSYILAEHLTSSVYVSENKILTIIQNHIHTEFK